MLENFIEWYENLNKNKTANTYKPHKPLTVIFALNHLLNGHRWIEYNRDKNRLNEFIELFISSKANCLYPLWRLRNDNKIYSYWKVLPDEGFIENKSGDISASQAESLNLKAGFSDDIYSWLYLNPQIAQFLIGEIIEDNFPETLEEEILNFLGIDETPPLIVDRESITRTVRRPHKDPNFPKKVMQAYDYRCSFCELKIYHNHRPFPMEAAHIKWKARGGECIESNGLSLCPTHHYTFDKGIWSLNSNLEIILNPNVMIDKETDRFFLGFEGKSIIKRLMDPKFSPSEEFVDWHRRNIFEF